MTTTVQADRLDIIRRAIAVIDAASPDDLARYLAQTDIHQHLRDDPAGLRVTLAEAFRDDAPHAVAGFLFSRYKAAQQILRAAGQPHN